MNVGVWIRKCRRRLDTFYHLSFVLLYGYSRRNEHKRQRNISKTQRCSIISGRTENSKSRIATSGARDVAEKMLSATEDSRPTRRKFLNVP